MRQDGARRADTARVRALLVGRRPARTLMRAAVLAVAAVVVFGFVLTPVRGKGPSMSPAIGDGDFFLVNRLAYTAFSPRRGDIVALRMAGPHVLYVKRIVALPAERVRIDAGIVFVEGAALEEPYVEKRRPWTTREITLGAGEYLVIGDNRGMAMEHHDFGIVQRARIVGRVVTLR